MGNLVLLDRFDGTLGGWTLDQTGGTVAIVTQDNSPKMRLNDTSGTQRVSATRSFTEPAGTYIAECDLYYAAGAGAYWDLLDSADNVIISVSLNISAGNASFSTDTVVASTRAFASGIYKQAVFVVDPVGNTAKCYISDEDALMNGGSLLQIGASKAYSGTAITKMRFRTDNAKQGIVYVDEVKVYTPQIFIIGDSLADGKNLWSCHPDYSYRKAATEDQTAPPHYHLQTILGFDGTSYWVSNRAFGSAKTAEVDAAIQAAVLDHGAAKVIISVGHNDCQLGVAMATAKANMQSILTRVQAAGITGSNIILCNVFPTSAINTDTERAFRQHWNNWLREQADAAGAVYVDLDKTLRSGLAPGTDTEPAYVYTAIDNLHLSSAGYKRMAQTIANAMDPAAESSADVLYASFGANEERLLFNYPDLSFGGRSLLSGFESPLLEGVLVR